MSDIEINKFGPVKNWRLACVKWFGGHNNATGKDNDFGFLVTNDNEDLYVHKNSILNKLSLVEGELVLYVVGNGNKGKIQATNIYVLSIKDIKIVEILYQYLAFSDEFLALHSYSIRNHLIKFLECDDGRRVVEKISDIKDRVTEYVSILAACSHKNNVLTSYIANIGIADAISHGISPSRIPKELIANHVKAAGIIDALSHGIPISSIPNDFIAEHVTTVGIIDALSHGIPISSIPNDLITEHVKTVGIIEALSHGIPISSIPNDLITEHVKTVGIIEALLHGIPISSIPNDLITEHVKTVGIIEALSHGIPISSIPNYLISEYAKMVGFVEAMSQGIPLSRMPNKLIAEYVRTAGVIRSHSHSIPLSIIPNDLIAEHVKTVGLDIITSHGIPLSIIPKIVIENYVKSVGIAKAISHGILITTMSNELIEEVINSKGIINVISDGISPLLIKKEIIDNHIIDFAACIDSMRAGKIRLEGTFDEIIGHISFSAALYLGFHQLIDLNIIINSWRNEIEEFVIRQLTKKDTGVANFVRDAYRSNFSSYEEYCRHPLILPFIKKSQIKEAIFSKNFGFVNDILSSPTLSSDPEFYILAKLLPLINQQNSPDAIIASILHDIWQALLDNKFSINHPSFFKLFPSCRTLQEMSPGIELSCEAFYWKTNTPEDIRRKKTAFGMYKPYGKDSLNAQGDLTIFLCRGRKCSDRHILPDLRKHYLHFNIYDWLSYYGAKYELLGQPSQRDLPIKLAGYLNRIREIYNRLHCRCCSVLMKPNLRYAKVELTTYDIRTNSFVTKPKNAAYRTTVFHCANENCDEYAVNYYINHCIGFKCYEIIDSRDLKEICSEGRYICNKCKSCCAYHKGKYGDVNNGELDNIKHQELYKDSPFYHGHDIEH